MTRRVQTFEARPVEHILESETVDYDNRSFAFTLFAHDDPNLITLHLGDYASTLSRDAMSEGLRQILNGIATLPPITRPKL